MTEPARQSGSFGASPERTTTSASGANLADILERVLDKGIVIAGDIQVNLLDIQLLTIKLRLLVASVDKAKEMGIDWWEHDRSLSSGTMSDERRPEKTDAANDRTRRLEAENDELRKRVAALERAAAPADGEGAAARTGHETTEARRQNP